MLGARRSVVQLLQCGRLGLDAEVARLRLDLLRSREPREVAAVGVTDEDYGQRLRAFVVRSGEVSEDDLREHVKTNLARFKVPREIVFVDELPRNATGKVLKKELREDGK